MVKKQQRTIQMHFKRILVLGAHPDDIEYGCFGILSEYQKQADLFAFVASLGSKADKTSGPIREKESIAALKGLRFKQIIFRQELGFSFENYTDISDEIFGLIDKIKPDLILTHSKHDTHQEHRLLHDMTLTAARRSQASILCYGTLSNTLKFSPTYFKDITPFFKSKKAALLKHKSQKNKYYMSEEYLEIFHKRQYCNLLGIKYSEAFEVERLLS
jgi:LmbE family N-acetylglucosaminyl deacetylase